MAFKIFLNPLGELERGFESLKGLKGQTPLVSVFPHKKVHTLSYLSYFLVNISPNLIDNAMVKKGKVGRQVMALMTMT